MFYCMMPFFLPERAVLFGAAMLALSVCNFLCPSLFHCCDYNLIIIIYKIYIILLLLLFTSYYYNTIIEYY
jgi:hypothetical protein